MNLLRLPQLKLPRRGSGANHFGGLAFFGMGILAVVIVVAIFAPWLAPFDLTHMDVTRQLEGPTGRHWLGTDENGADVLTLLIYGTRVAVVVGVSVVTICSTVGVVLGAI